MQKREDPREIPKQSQHVEKPRFRGKDIWIFLGSGILISSIWDFSAFLNFHRRLIEYPEIRDPKPTLVTMKKNRFYFDSTNYIHLQRIHLGNNKCTNVFHNFYDVFYVARAFNKKITFLPLFINFRRFKLTYRTPTADISLLLFGNNLDKRRAPDPHNRVNYSNKDREEHYRDETPVKNPSLILSNQDFWL